MFRRHEVNIRIDLQHYHIKHYLANVQTMVSTNASKWQMGFNSAFKGLN
jgi:hypothetical protein